MNDTAAAAAAAAAAAGLPKGGDPVTRALLPMLLHEVRGATQLLVGLRAVLDMPGGEELFERRAPDLAATSERMHELGFAMAVLATASGANMLMARRDKNGLATLQELARRAAIRVDGAPPEVHGEVPRIAPSALDGWQIPWAGAALLTLVPERRWRWSDRVVLVGSPTQGAPLIDEHALAVVRERVPGSTLEVVGEDVVWTLPADWITGD